MINVRSELPSFEFIKTCQLSLREITFKLLDPAKNFHLKHNKNTKSQRLLMHLHDHLS